MQVSCGIKVKRYSLLRSPVVSSVPRNRQFHSAESPLQQDCRVLGASLSQVSSFSMYVALKEFLRRPTMTHSETELEYVSYGAVGGPELRHHDDSVP